MPTPGVGHIVHYQTLGTPGGEYPSVPVAAIVTAVHTDSVDLCVFYPNGLSFKTDVEQAMFDDAPTPGMWNRPPAE